MSRTLSTIVGLVLLAPAAASAQDAPPGPPPVLSIYREQVKPGKGGAHEKNETAWAQAFLKSKSPVRYLAMTSIAGPTEAWYLEAHKSFAEIETNQQAVGADAALAAEVDVFNARDGELVSAISQMIAVYREDLSYQPIVDIAKMRYFRVAISHVKPGHDDDLEALRKLVNEGHEKAKMDEHWAVYEVLAGAASGTYLTFFPMKSLAEMDGLKDMHGEAYRNVVGESNRKRIRELVGAAIEGSKIMIFQFNPKMSAPPKEFAARDAEFWTPKPAAPAKK